MIHSAEESLSEHASGRSRHHPTLMPPGGVSRKMRTTACSRRIPLCQFLADSCTGSSMELAPFISRTRAGYDRPTESARYGYSLPRGVRHAFPV